jgi:hypothetical protein
MSLQMVQYRSSNLQYPGHAKMQKATQINRKKQGIDEEALVECNIYIKRVSYLQYLDEK